MAAGPRLPGRTSDKGRFCGMPCPAASRQVADGILVDREMPVYEEEYQKIRERAREQAEKEQGKV